MTIRLPSITICLALTAATAISSEACSQDAPRLANDDTVTVEADEAWEELNQDVTHFQGNFRLSGPDWSVLADKAVLYGSLENPEKVIADGNPARILVQKSQSEGQIMGQGSHIEYQKSRDVVELSGAATVTDEGNTMTSSLLRYDLVAEQISASGEEGVKMVIDPGGQ